MEGESRLRYALALVRRIGPVLPGVPLGWPARSGTLSRRTPYIVVAGLLEIGHDEWNSFGCLFDDNLRT